jgi:hypothetical protein
MVRPVPLVEEGLNLSVTHKSTLFHLIVTRTVVFVVILFPVVSLFQTEGDQWILCSIEG